MYEGSSFAWSMSLEISHDCFVPKSNIFIHYRCICIRTTHFSYQLTQNSLKTPQPVLPLQSVFCIRITYSSRMYSRYTRDVLPFTNRHTNFGLIDKNTSIYNIPLIKHNFNHEHFLGSINSLEFFSNKVFKSFTCHEQ